jgi:hypothetical protein
MEANQHAVAAYIGEIAGKLGRQAKAARLTTLSYLLEMAVMEADQIKKGKGDLDSSTPAGRQDRRARAAPRANPARHAAAPRAPSARRPSILPKPAAP